MAYQITATAMPMYAVPQEDAELFLKWVWDQREQTDFDMKTLSYPRSCMTRAQNDTETLMLLPLQPVLMFESLIRKPGLTDRQSALGLFRIGQVVEDAMKKTGHAEAYFLTNSEQEANTCANHGWVKALHDPEKKIWLMKRQVQLPDYRSAAPIADGEKCA
jgi:hypothetical protein